METRVMIKEKIKTREALEGICDALRRHGKKIGFTSGTFDLIHAGHADYLENAKFICDTLIVGINSDVSVKKYKGINRPFVSENQRAIVVAALESVDYVFIFNERRNKKNIEVLKPSFYLKAGDYKQEELTSLSIVEKYGGKVQIIPLTESISTSDIINKISNLSIGSTNELVEEGGAGHIKLSSSKQSPAIFLDRDGTINEEVSYLHEPERFKIIPNAVNGIKKLQDMGYKIIIISNQPGIGMGYYTKEDFYRVNRKMLTIFSKEGILVDKIYFCPHSKSEACSCRKPDQELIKRAEKDLNIDIKRSIFIGDKTSDIEAGRRAGMKTILVMTGFAGKDGEFDAIPDKKVEDISEAAETILEMERR